jgi:hypothetical protein
VVEGGGLGSGCDGQFGEDVGYVEFDRGLADVEVVGDGAVAVALGQAFEDLEFAGA